MTTTANAPSGGPTNPAGLQRSVGFWGLMFVSLGSIIGSGWLLGALNAAKNAGPAALLSWVLAAVMLTILALSHAELGTSYPVTGGTARFPYFAFGSLAGFTAGWSSWLQAVAIAPLEIEAAITYVNSVKSVHEHFDMLKSDGATLNGLGLLVASLLMILFTVMNLVGAKFLAESNSVAVIWKTAVPLLTVVVIAFLSFHAANFTGGTGFAPYGAHGVFQALSLGVVFALQGFEQAVQMAGEAKNPQKDISRAIIAAMAAGALLYIALQFVFIGAVKHDNVLKGWMSPFGAQAASDYGAYYTLALAVGAGWLAKVLIADAIISPSGTGLVYLGTSARLSYALGKEEVLPDQLTKVSRRGIPWVSVLVAFVVGEICFLPFPSWNSMVNIVTGATAVMYAFAPIALAALHQRDPDRERPYRMPWPKVLNPLGFFSANLIIYWGGFDSMWKLLAAIFLGRVIFEVMLYRTDIRKRLDIDFRAASWIWPWLVGLLIISVMGQYGNGHMVIGEWWDILTVFVFSMVVFYWAVSLAMSTEHVQEAVKGDEEAPVDAVLAGGI